VIQHWEPDARTLGRCLCGGALRLVEDDGPPQPVEAQCDRCLTLTGMPRGAIVDNPRLSADVVVPGSPEDLGF
jgi:hypothetical protein